MAYTDFPSYSMKRKGNGSIDLVEHAFLQNKPWTPSIALTVQ
jgi:hypothetical protein